MRIQHYQETKSLPHFSPPTHTPHGVQKVSKKDVALWYFLEETENLSDLEFDDEFLIHQKQDTWKKKLVKLDFIKIKNFNSMKEKLKRIKRQSN